MILKNLYSTVPGSLNSFKKQGRSSQLACLSITNQRETSMIWTVSGKPVANAAYGSVRRCTDLHNLKKKVTAKPLKENRTDNRFLFLSKQAAMDNQQYREQELARKGDLLLGTMDTWLL
jgi:glycerol kinase